MLTEVAPILRHERDPLVAETLFHNVGRFKLAPARERPVPVHHAVAGQAAPHGVLEGPPDDPGRPAAPEVLGDVAVRGHAARRNVRNDGPDALEKRPVGDCQTSLRSRLTVLRRRQGQ